MSPLWELTKTLAALAILAALGWFSYSLWKERSTSEVESTVPGASFNCRKALADLATGSACRDSGSCKMTDYQLEQLRKLETNINIYCD